MHPRTFLRASRGAAAPPGLARAAMVRDRGESMDRRNAVEGPAMSKRATMSGLGSKQPQRPATRAVSTVRTEGGRITLVPNGISLQEQWAQALFEPLSGVRTVSEAISPPSVTRVRKSVPALGSSGAKLEKRRSCLRWLSEISTSS